MNVHSCFFAMNSIAVSVFVICCSDRRTTSTANSPQQISSEATRKLATKDIRSAPDSEHSEEPGSSTSRPTAIQPVDKSAPGSEPKEVLTPFVTEVRCIYMLRDPGCFSDGDSTAPQKHQDAVILNDIETYFFVQLERQRIPERIAVSPRNWTHVFDNKSPDGKFFSIKVLGAELDQERNCIHRLTISASEDSKFELNADLTVDIPDNGSVVLRSAPKNGSNSFLWIAAYKRTESKVAPSNDN